jgi:hypothetical protein
MDAYVFLALVIIILLLGLMLFVVYKESGWKFVKEDEHRGHRGHHSERERHRWYHERNKPHNHY